MKRSLFLLLIMILYPMAIFAQDDTEFQTDSSVVITKYFKYLNSIRVFNELKNKSRTYYTDYFYDTKKIREEGIFSEDNDHLGTSRVYSPDGKIISETNHDFGTWTVYKKDEYPFYEKQSKIKLKADSLIQSVYGQDFFNKHVTWKIDGSAIYNKNESGDWVDKFEKEPNRFLFRYNLRFDPEHIYRGIIEFELDSIGTFIPNQSEVIYGFEKVPDHVNRNFKLNFVNAIERAKEKGLVESDSNKAITFLKWESFRKPELYNGHFRFYVIIKTGLVKDIVPRGRSSITEKFDVYSFNPWTGDFIEKKKMKSISSWEERSGSSTGLIEDK
jgi:hypothetical protein